MRQWWYNLRTYHLDNALALIYWIKLGKWRKFGYENFARAYRYSRYRIRQIKHELEMAEKRS